MIIRQFWSIFDLLLIPWLAFECVCNLDFSLNPLFQLQFPTEFSFQFLTSLLIHRILEFPTEFINYHNVSRFPTESVNSPRNYHHNITRFPTESVISPRNLFAATNSLRNNLSLLRDSQFEAQTQIEAQIEAQNTGFVFDIIDFMIILFEILSHMIPHGISLTSVCNSPRNSVPTWNSLRNSTFHLEFPTEFNFNHGFPHGIQLSTWNSPQNSASSMEFPTEFSFQHGIPHGIQLSTWNSPWNSTFIMEFPTEFIHNYMITGSFPVTKSSDSPRNHSIPHGIAPHSTIPPEL